MLVCLLSESVDRPGYSKVGDANQAVVHLALLSGQTINGLASVVAKVGLPRLNPVFFALLREVIATPLLFCVAFLAHGCPRVACRDLPLLGVAAFALFSNQLAYTAGLKMENPAVGSAWQPSQPIFVLGLAVLLRWEKCTVPKTLGILFALAGGATMTLSAPAAAGGRSNSPVAGNLLFFYNCVMTAVFVLCMRVITKRLPPYHALAIVYMVASVGILLVALGVSASQDLQQFFCPDCTESFWTFPSGAIFALSYWILGSSVTAYLLLTFGTKHAQDATHCLAYTAMQPVAAGLLETFMVLAGWNAQHPDSDLELLNGLQVCGGCFVIFGVACVPCEAKIRSFLSARKTKSPNPQSLGLPLLGAIPAGNESQPIVGEGSTDIDIDNQK